MIIFIPKMSDHLWNNSVYIPRIPLSITKQQLTEFFTDVCVCFIKRIDFIDFNNSHGSGRHAFVHFGRFDEETIKNWMMQEGGWVTTVQKHTVRIMVNKKPILATELNLDQVASNTLILSDEIQRQAQKIAILEYKLEEMEARLRQ